VGREQGWRWNHSITEEVSCGHPHDVNIERVSERGR
jgi:hypothetical protein